MIELRELSIRSGTFRLQRLSLQIASGVYAVLMGGTGQGKTTILEAICGLRPVESGSIAVDGHDMTRWKPAHRNLGYVPQDLALFPTMTVREHLEFALRLRRVARQTIAQRVAELADVLDIGPLLARRIPGLSGGEAQRVALGRALSFRPRVLLLDEPLGALDELTRDRLCELLRNVQQTHGLTVLHITHSRTEARLLADRLFVLTEGQVAERPLSELGTSPPTADHTPVARLPLPQ